MLGFGVENIAENGQKQEVFASDKVFFQFPGSLANQKGLVMVEEKRLKIIKGCDIISLNHQMWQ